MPTTTSEFKKRFSDIPEEVIPKDVTVHKANAKAWPILNGISIVHVEIPANGIRAPHLHTNASELSVIVKGSAIATLINTVGERIEVILEEGDCVYFPQNWPHWLVNTSDDTLISYFNYSNEQPITVELDKINMERGA
jgi:oxalate decarboxylase/phosphoglucose isomerase-like protein (cupin superfamily)